MIEGIDAFNQETCERIQKVDVMTQEISEDIEFYDQMIRELEPLRQAFLQSGPPVATSSQMTPQREVKLRQLLALHDAKTKELREYFVKRRTAYGLPLN